MTTIRRYSSLWITDNASEYARQSGISVKVVEDRKFYELFDRGKKVADLEIMKVGGASKMPTALAQDVIDVGFGGVAPVLASTDSGAPIKRQRSPDKADSAASLQG